MALLLMCTACGGPYMNASPAYMLPDNIKKFDKHGVCLRCDVTSNMGEFINSIGTEEFNLREDVEELTPVYTPLKPVIKIRPVVEPSVQFGNRLAKVPAVQLNLF